MLWLSGIRDIRDLTETQISQRGDAKMNTFLIFLQVFAATTMLISGVAKLISLLSFQETLKQLGFHEKWVKSVSFAVPAAEIVISILMFTPSAVLIGASFILIMLVGFGWSVWKAKGKNVKCNCFGALSSEYLGLGTIARIIALAIIALALLFIDQIPTGSFIEIFLAISTSITILAIYLLIIESKIFHGKE
jgi:hypothetical protein